MNSINVVSVSSGFEEALRYFAEEGVLVNVFLRSYPMGYDVPKEVLEQTRNIRIVHVGKECVVLGPKRPLVTSVIPIDEIAMVLISSETHRPDEEEVDRRIEEQYPTWERDFARKIESAMRGKRLIGDTGEIMSLDDSSFQKVIQGTQFVILDVYAPWCQPCKEVAAILEELHTRFSDRVLFAKLDGDESEDIAEDLGISAYPTVILFENGNVKKKIEGSRNIEYYTKEVEILLGLKKKDQTRNQVANGKVNTLSSDCFVDVIEDTPVSVVMFYERGEYNCQLQSRVMNEVAKEYKKKVLFVKVDVDANEDLADLFEVEYIPEVYFILNGEVQTYADGRLTKSELKEGIAELLAAQG